jgi:hypothetical protein
VLAWYGIISDVTTEHELALRVEAGAAAAQRSVQRLTSPAGYCLFRRRTGKAVAEKSAVGLIVRLMALACSNKAGQGAYCSNVQTKKGPGQIAQAWLDARLKPQIATGQTHSQTRRHRVCPYYMQTPCQLFSG